MLSREKQKKVYLVGDSNLDILDTAISQKVRDFTDLLYEKGLINLINKPTRITQKRATIIDNIAGHIFQMNQCISRIAETDISDHFPIYSSTKFDSDNDITHRSVVKRNFYSEYRMRNFKHTLQLTNWDSVLNLGNADFAYNQFLERFLSIYNEFFLVEEIKLKEKDIKNPWITRGLKKSSRKKQRFYEKFSKKKNE